jgi:hypothetical protein
MARKVNLVENIVVGEYGYPIYLRLVNDLSDAVDISGYDTVEVIIRTPDDVKTITYTAYIVTTGVDGKLYFVPADGDLDRPGEWTGLIKLTNTAVGVTKSQPFVISILESL